MSWWPGDGNANDIMSTNHGILSGDATATADGMVGQAFSFDGSGDFVEVPHDVTLNLAQFSVDAWVFIDPALNAGQFNAFVGKSDGSSAGGGFYFAHDDRNLLGEPTTEGALDFAVISGPSVISRGFLQNAFTDADFYHLAATFDGSQARLYLNGTLVDTGDSIPGIAFNTLSLRIGAIHLTEVVGPDDRFEGLIDEVELFNRALTGEEIRAIYEAGSAGKIKPEPRTVLFVGPGPNGEPSDFDIDGDGNIDSDDEVIIRLDTPLAFGQFFDIDLSLGAGQHTIFDVTYTVMTGDSSTMLPLLDRDFDGAVDAFDIEIARPTTEGNDIGPESVMVLALLAAANGQMRLQSIQEPGAGDRFALRWATPRQP